MKGTTDKKPPFTKEDMLNIRSGGPDGAYGFVCRELLPCVVGAVRWRKCVRWKRISKFVPMTDEAFCLFCIENSYDHWVSAFMYKMAKDEGKDVSNMQVEKPLYTVGVGRKARKYAGWRKKGRKRWNQICKEVLKSREENTEFDEEFLKAYQAEKNKGKGSERESDDSDDSDSDEEEEEEMMNDLPE